MFHRGAQIFLAVFSSLLVVQAFAADRVGGVKSASAGITLRAVLVQSLHMSVDPQPSVFNSFITSNADRDFPVTIKTDWVRGPGCVNVVVLSSPEWSGVGTELPVSVMASDTTVAPAVEIESGALPFSADNKNEVLTIRAQVI